MLLRQLNMWRPLLLKGTPVPPGKLRHGRALPSYTPVHHTCRELRRNAHTHHTTRIDPRDSPFARLSRVSGLLSLRPGCFTLGPGQFDRGFMARHYAVLPQETPLPPAAFVDPNAYYPRTEITDESILADLESFSPAHKPWAQMALHARETPPGIGSFVEFRVSGEIRFGVLLLPPPCLFNQFHNRLIVLTIHNELMRVSPQDYTFVSFEVMREECVPASEILQNRFDDTFPARRRLVQHLHQYLVLVQEYKGRVDMRQVWLGVAGRETAAFSLHEVAGRVAEKLPFWDAQRPDILPSASPNSLRQSALLMALYLNMCAGPADWIVPHCFEADRISNLSAYNASNALAPSPVYFAVPTLLLSTLSEFMDYTEEDLLHINKNLSPFLSQPKDLNSYDKLTLELAVADMNRLKPTVEAMKFAVAFPHAGLIAQLGKIASIGPHASQKSIFQYLTDLGLYNNPCNPLSDPVILSLVLGNVSQKSVVACSTRDLEPSPTAQNARSETDLFTDHFPHLRGAHGSQKVYVVPGLHKSLAFSLDKLNSRRYLLRVHIPDLAAYLGPASAAFRSWAKEPGSSVQRTLPKELLRYMQFQLSAKSTFSVGDSKKPAPWQTCMTLTFQYNTLFEDSLADLQNLVSVSFDRVAVHRIVEVSPKLFEKTLTGRLEPSVFRKFRLFSHSTTEEEVSDDEHHDLNFVYSMMRRHFESRNRHSGINVNDAQKKVDRKYSVQGDFVKTEMLLGDSSEKTDFLRREIGIFAGRMTSVFCQKHGVPVFHRHRLLLFPESRAENDQVLIRHSNTLLPDFSSNSYFQAAFARDVRGNVSMQAFLHASNFVGPEIVSVDRAAHVTLGVHGYVQIGMATPEEYINQLQLLQAVHFLQTSRVDLFQKRAFAHLRALGYNLHGPSEASLLGAHAETIQVSTQGHAFLQEKRRRYWTLKAVEMHPDWFGQMKCTVTCASRDVDMQDHPDTQLLRVYCEDLGLEALMYAPADPGMMLGMARWGAVHHVDAVQGLLILV